MDALVILALSDIIPASTVTTGYLIAMFIAIVIFILADLFCKQ